MSAPFAAFVVPAALPRARRISVTRPRFAATSAARAGTPTGQPRRRSRSSSLHVDWIRAGQRIALADDDPDSRAAVVRAAKTQDAAFRASAREAANAWAAELALLRTNRTPPPPLPSPSPATAAATSAQKLLQVPVYRAGAVVAAVAAAGKAELTPGQVSFFERMARLNAVVSGSVAPSKTLTVPTVEASTTGPSLPLVGAEVTSEKREGKSVAAAPAAHSETVLPAAPMLPNPPPPVTVAPISATSMSEDPAATQNEMAPDKKADAVPDRSPNPSGPAKEPSDADLAESLATRSRQVVPSMKAASVPRSPRIVSRDLGPVALATSTGSISQASAMKDAQRDQSIPSEAKNMVVISILALFICVCLALGEGYQSMASNLPFIM